MGDIAMSCPGRKQARSFSIPMFSVWAPDSEHNGGGPGVRGRGDSRAHSGEANTLERGHGSSLVNSSVHHGGIAMSCPGRKQGRSLSIPMFSVWAHTVSTMRGARTGEEPSPPKGRPAGKILDPHWSRECGRCASAVVKGYLDLM